MKEGFTESVVVSIDVAEDGVSAALIVGKTNKMNGTIEIVNAVQGKEAISIWDNLTKPKKRFDDEE